MLSSKADSGQSSGLKLHDAISIIKQDCWKDCCTISGD
jgi:hypothetical protein